MQQQVGLARFRQRGAERGDQLMRQVAHETDGVGEHQRMAGQLDAAHRRVQRGEQLVGGVGIRAGQGIEQRGLAGVGVAHQRDPGQLVADAGAAHLGALHLDLVESLLQLLQALLQQPAVGLQLGLTRATQADGTAAQAVQMGPAADEPGRHVLELGQFDLQLALVTAGALGENVQDQAGTVDHAAAQDALQVALLDRAQGVVDQHQVGLGGSHGGLHFLKLAGADQDRGVGVVNAGVEGGNHRRPGRAGELGEFVQLVRIDGTARMGLDQKRTFTLAGAFKQEAGPLWREESCQMRWVRPRQTQAIHTPRLNGQPVAAPSSPSAAWTCPPLGPTRTLRAGTTVEMACL